MIFLLYLSTPIGIDPVETNEALLCLGVFMAWNVKGEILYRHVKKYDPDPKSEYLQLHAKQ
jgi:hypothetical protein